MLTNVFLAFNMTTIASAPIGNAIGTLLPASFLVCAVIMVVGGLRLRALMADHTTQAQQLQQQNDLIRAGQEQLHKLRADLDEKQREMQTLRLESGTQRKKNHVTQDEIKRLRASLKEETERRIAAQNTRPAFAEPTKPKSVAHAAKTLEATAARPTQAQPTPTVATPATVEGPGPSELALQAQVKTLEAEITRQKQTLGDERASMLELRDEIKKMRKRSEDLRRIDIITKSKMEILEDKLRHLGRAHYEAISEVALLKGEVKPPQPRSATRQTSMFEAPEMARTADRSEAADVSEAADMSEAADEKGDEFAAAGRHDAPGVAQQAALL